METIKIDNYQFDVTQAIKEIKTKQAKRVLVQLPDGLKYSSQKIIDTFQRACPDTVFYLWLNTNFGSCDLPLGLEKLRFDMIIHFGHAQWR